MIYSHVPEEELHRMFMICFITDVLFFALYYPIGLIGTWKKSYKLLQVFATMSIVGIFV
jgi:hypothetical protein